MNITDALAAFTAMTAPAALITACSLLLLGVYDKYSKIIASLRALNGELRDNEGNRAEPAYRRQQIRDELSLLRRRLRSVLAQVSGVAAAMVLFLGASLALGATVVLHVGLGAVSVAMVVLGLVALIVAMILAVIEARFIWQVIDHELQAPVSLPEAAMDRLSRADA